MEAGSTTAPQGSLPLSRRLFGGWVGLLAAASPAAAGGVWADGAAGFGFDGLGSKVVRGPRGMISVDRCSVLDPRIKGPP